MNNWLNIIGLCFDITGVIMLFKYGLPSDLNKEGLTLQAWEGINESEVKKWKHYDKMSKIALTLVILGFLFQLSSSLVSILK